VTRRPTDFELALCDNRGRFRADQNWLAIFVQQLNTEVKPSAHHRPPEQIMPTFAP
jgi:hypothetical protein